MRGNGTGKPGIPRRTQRSRWFSETPRTRTSAWPGPGVGFGTSSTFKTEGSPCWWMRTTCIELTSPSAPLELGRALLDEGGDAFLGVGRGEELGLQLALEREAGLERELGAGLHGALDVPDGEG